MSTPLERKDPRCSRCGRTLEELENHGVLEIYGNDDGLCIDCMTPEERREHGHPALEDEEIEADS